MSLTTYGRAYNTDARLLRDLPLAASEAITIGDMVALDGNGYGTQAGAGDVAYGVAAETKTGGSADGDVKCKVDVSRETIYRYPPDAGSVTEALRGKTCDVGGAQSIDIDASTDDCIEIVDVDVANNFVLVKIKPALAGVI